MDTGNQIQFKQKDHTSVENTAKRPKTLLGQKTAQQKSQENGTKFKGLFKLSDWIPCQMMTHRLIRPIRKMPR